MERVLVSGTGSLNDERSATVVLVEIRFLGARGNLDGWVGNFDSTREQKFNDFMVAEVDGGLCKVG